MPRIKNITIDCQDPGKLATFWQAATGYSIELSNEDLAYLWPTESGAPRLLLLKVPEPRTGKNRAHFDLEVDNRELEIERLTRLGATRGETHNMQSLVWTVMQDPEGNEFCLAEPEGGSKKAAIAPDG